MNETKKYFFKSWNLGKHTSSLVILDYLGTMIKNNRFSTARVLFKNSCLFSLQSEQDYKAEHGDIIENESCPIAMKSLLDTVRAPIGGIGIWVLANQSASVEPVTADWLHVITYKVSSAQTAQLLTSQV